MKTLVDPDLACGAPDHNIGAWLLWMQGQSYDQNSGVGCQANLDDSKEDGRLTDKQLRYIAYTSWINGAQGAMFWELSKSDPDMFARARRISHEAFLLRKYLLEPDAGINATITSLQADDETAQFIIKKNPNFAPNSTHKSKVMLMVCNNSDRETSLWVQFPQDQQIDFSTVQGINLFYYWSFTEDSVNNRIGVGIAGSDGRSFTFKIKAD